MSSSGQFSDSTAQPITAAVADRCMDGDELQLMQESGTNSYFVGWVSLVLIIGSASNAKCTTRAQHNVGFSNPKSMRFQINLARCVHDFGNPSGLGKVNLTADAKSGGAGQSLNLAHLARCSSIELRFFTVPQRLPYASATARAYCRTNRDPSPIADSP